jgi:hypothetical protein
MRLGPQSLPSASDPDELEVMGRIGDAPDMVDDHSVEAA